MKNITKKNWKDLTKKEKVIVVICILVFIWVIGMILPSSSTPKENPVETSVEEKYTATERVACRDFAKLYLDVRDGILNDKELRERTQKFYNNARLSNLLKEPATELLSSMTQNRIEDMQIVFLAISLVCADVLD